MTTHYITCPVCSEEKVVDCEHERPDPEVGILAWGATGQINEAESCECKLTEEQEQDVIKEAEERALEPVEPEFYPEEYR